MLPLRTYRCIQLHMQKVSVSGVRKLASAVFKLHLIGLNIVVVRFQQSINALNELDIRIILRHTEDNFSFV